MGAPLASCPSLQIATRELYVIGTLRYSTGCFEDGVDLLKRDQAVAAFQAIKEGKEVKVVITNQE